MQLLLGILVLPRIASDKLVSAVIYDNVAAIGGVRDPIYPAFNSVTGHLRDCLLYETRNPHTGFFVTIQRHAEKYVQYMIVKNNSLEDEIAGTKMTVQVMTEQL